MSTELVYRMRTCAAALADGRVVPMTEAADLLIEASNLLDTTDELGEPMEVIEVAMLADRVGSPGVALWGGDLPKVGAKPCPSCNSIDARTVRRLGRRLMLTCPTCSHSWEYGK
jgi:hypothetical protein